MSSSPVLRRSPPGSVLLHNGDHLAQPEFHRRYEVYPEDVKFELVGGIVYMASPLRRSHGRRHSQLGSILQRYSEETQGVETLDNVTTILGEESEPQPDLALCILSEYGGQSRETADDYVEGPPELVGRSPTVHGRSTCTRSAWTTSRRVCANTWYCASRVRN